MGYSIKIRFADILIVGAVFSAGFMFSYFRASGSEDGRILAFGDSLIEGYRVAPEDNFVSGLSAETGVFIENAGQTGDNTFDALERLEDDVISKHPEIVIIMLGGGDILDGIPRSSTFSNLRMIIERIRDSGSDVILLGFSSAGYGDDFVSLASETGVYFVPDVLNGITLNPSLTIDLLHPNPEGYRIMAARVAPTLRAVIGAPPVPSESYPSYSPMPYSPIPSYSPYSPRYSPEIPPVQTTGSYYGGYNPYYGNYAYGAYIPPIPTPFDFAPRIIIESVSDVTPGSVIVNWITDEPADGRVEYCPTPISCDNVAGHNGFSAEHRVQITNLRPETLYYYWITTRDVNGNTTTTRSRFDMRTFKTAPAPTPFPSPFPTPFQIPPYYYPTPSPTPFITPYPYPTPRFTPFPQPPLPTADFEGPWIMRDYPDNITFTSADIFWTTNESADGQVEYCTEKFHCGVFSQHHGISGTEHMISLSDLMPGTRYYYWIYSRDSAGNLRIQGFRSFTTDPALF